MGKGKELKDSELGSDFDWMWNSGWICERKVGSERSRGSLKECESGNDWMSWCVWECKWIRWESNRNRKWEIEWKSRCRRELLWEWGSVCKWEKCEWICDCEWRSARGCCEWS